MQIFQADTHKKGNEAVHVDHVRNRKVCPYSQKKILRLKFSHHSTYIMYIFSSSD